MKYLVLKRLFEKSRLYQEGDIIELSEGRAIALGDYVKKIEEGKDTPEKNVVKYKNKMVRKYKRKS